MRRALYRLEDRLFYAAAVLPAGAHARLYILCSHIMGALGDRLGEGALTTH